MKLHTFLEYSNQPDNSHIETFLEYYKDKKLKETQLKNVSNQ